MIKLIHADDFFPNGAADQIRSAVSNLEFSPMEYGDEIENFHMIEPGISEVFSKYLGQKVKIDEGKSGIFRKPMKCIHFESFNSPDEWCFAVALEPSTFNTYHHLKNFNDIDAKTVFDEYKFNYQNLFEWDVSTNVQLETNQCLFFRPWLFHSLDGGLILYFKLLPDNGEQS